MAPSWFDEFDEFDERARVRRNPAYVGYHGSPGPVEAFDLDHMDRKLLCGPGIYFTSDQEEAEVVYAKSEGYIYRCRVSIKRPLRIKGFTRLPPHYEIQTPVDAATAAVIHKAFSNLVNGRQKRNADWKRSLAALKRLGFDGTVVELDVRGGFSHHARGWYFYIVYSPEQVLSKTLVRDADGPVRPKKIPARGARRRR